MIVLRHCRFTAKDGRALLDRHQVGVWPQALAVDMGIESRQRVCLTGVESLHLSVAVQMRHHLAHFGDFEA